MHSSMLQPKVKQCADGHYCCAIYGLRLYIADDPEQVLLACIVQDWCPMYVVPTWFLLLTSF